MHCNAHCFQVWLFGCFFYLFVCLLLCFVCLFVCLLVCLFVWWRGWGGGGGAYEWNDVSSGQYRTPVTTARMYHNLSLWISEVCGWTVHTDSPTLSSSYGTFSSKGATSHSLTIVLISLPAFLWLYDNRIIIITALDA